MTSRNALTWLLVIAALGGGGYMMKLMGEMTHQVGLMRNHVASLARDLTEMNQKVGAMTEHVAHMDRNMEVMARHMGRIDRTIHKSGETFQQWNPMDFLSPRGSGGR